MTVGGEGTKETCGWAEAGMGGCMEGWGRYAGEFAEGVRRKYELLMSGR